MILPTYLAMTAQEIAKFGHISSTLCYMACHFSPNGQGLIGLPAALPPNSLLCIDDLHPISKQDLPLLVRQIEKLQTGLHLNGILLDFQRPNNPIAPMVIAAILECACCKTAVSHIYAKDFSCPVFLPPLPLRTSLDEYLHRWQGREIWLELGTEKEKAILTKDGFRAEAISGVPRDIPCFEDANLLCHYNTQVKQDHIAFYLYRTAQDIRDLQSQAKKLGVAKFIGLWQQLEQFYSIVDTHNLR